MDRYPSYLAPSLHVHYITSLIGNSLKTHKWIFFFHWRMYWKEGWSPHHTLKPLYQRKHMQIQENGQELDRVINSSLLSTTSSGRRAHHLFQTQWKIGTTKIWRRIELISLPIIKKLEWNAIIIKCAKFCSNFIIVGVEEGYHFHFLCKRFGLWEGEKYEKGRNAIFLFSNFFFKSKLYT